MAKVWLDYAIRLQKPGFYCYLIDLLVNFEQKKQDWLHGGPIVTQFNKLFKEPEVSLVLATIS